MQNLESLDKLSVLHKRRINQTSGVHESMSDSTEMIFRTIECFSDDGKLDVDELDQIVKIVNKHVSLTMGPRRSHRIDRKHSPWPHGLHG